MTGTVIKDLGVSGPTLVLLHLSLEMAVSNLQNSFDTLETTSVLKCFTALVMHSLLTDS